MEFSVYQRPKPGCQVMGDIPIIQKTREGFLVGIIDGLGSGFPAQQVATEVKELIGLVAGERPKSIIDFCNSELKSQRGAVLGIGQLNLKTEEITFCGLGNIGCLVFNESPQCCYLISSPGFIPNPRAKYLEMTSKIVKGNTIILYSDGVAKRQEWNEIVREENNCQDILNRIVDNLKTNNDDITIIVGK